MTARSVTAAETTTTGAPEPAATHRRRLLDALYWAYVTEPRRALGFEFAVRVMDPALGTYLEQILVPRTSGVAATHLYSLVDRGPGAARRYPLYFDGTRLAVLETPSMALSYLLWHVNQEVVARTDDYVLVHAAALEHRGLGLILPAPMESGKTTLAAGLIQHGLRYLSDEAAAIDPVTGDLHPFAKALSIDPGSWGVLGALRPRVAEAVRPYVGGQWHVPPDHIRAGASAPPCRPGLVLAPRYVRGGQTALEPMRRGEGFRLLVENSFNMARLGPVGLRALADAAIRCRCYRLTVGDLRQACQLVLGLVEADVDTNITTERALHDR